MVKPWDELTERGKLRRLRTVALAALDDYSVDVRKVSLIGGFINALFRGDTPDGPLALRVELMQDHTDTDAQLELEWLCPVTSMSGCRSGPATMRCLPTPRPTVCPVPGDVCSSPGSRAVRLRTGSHRVCSSSTAGCRPSSICTVPSIDP